MSVPAAVSPELELIVITVGFVDASVLRPWESTDIAQEGAVRVLLDTNIWSYVAATGCERDLVRTSREANVQVVVPPSVVEEALRLPDRLARRRLIELLTHRQWTHLLPEAHAEAMDFLSLVSTRRSAWLWAEAKLDRYEAEARSFDGPDGYWRFARRFTTVAAQGSMARERESLARERAWAEEDRQLFADQQFESLDVLARGRLAADLPGYEGEETDVWRGEALVRYWSGTSERGGDPLYYGTWIEPFIDVARMRDDQASFVKLLLHEATSGELPRLWTRCAVRLAQATRRTTRGTPGDNLLSTWWCEVDAFVTADRAFGEISDKVRDVAPMPLARTVVVPAGSGAASAACQAILDYSG